MSLLIFAACLIAGCDESVSSNYSTRADAEADRLFTRGWLPEIIPPSSHNISMRNDLDLNVSNGEFSFDPSDYGAFVTQLERVSSQDQGESLAYVYEDWTFWINDDKNHCRFHIRPTRENEQSEQ